MSNPPSLAPCSKAPSTRKSAASSAPITRPAPMWSASSSPRSWSRCAPIGADAAVSAEKLMAEGASASRPSERHKKNASDDFHNQLCLTRVLDPACGTGNFLYVALELIKQLEDEVIDALVSMGGRESLALARPSHRRSASIPGARSQSPRRRHCRTGAVDRLPAAALPHPDGAPGRADSARLREHQFRPAPELRRGADLGWLADGYRG